MSALAGIFFLKHASAVVVSSSFVEMGIAGLNQMNSIFRGVAFIAGGFVVAAKLYPKLVLESFNNKKEALEALQACFKD